MINFLSACLFPPISPNFVSMCILCGGHDGHDGQSQNEKRQCQNRHYNINILFIYSEQMTAFPKSILTKMTMTKMTTMYGKNLEVTK